jgi:glutathione reductase (NADPH)
LGFSETAARKHSAKARVNAGKMCDRYTARGVGESVYGYKTLVEEKNGLILGAHLVVINLFGLAIC